MRKVVAFCRRQRQARSCGEKRERLFSARLGLFPARGEHLGEVEKAAANERVSNAIIGVDDFDGFAPTQRIGLEGFRGRFGKAARDGWGAHGIHVVEKKRDGDVEHPGKIVQSAGADAIGAAFIFLNLLKGEADRLAELLSSP